MINIITNIPITRPAIAPGDRLALLPLFLLLNWVVGVDVGVLVLVDIVEVPAKSIGFQLNFIIPPLLTCWSKVHING